MTPLPTGKNQQQQQHQQAAMQVAGGNPRLTQLCSRWQQVWLLALDRQRKLNDALDRLEEVLYCNNMISPIRTVEGLRPASLSRSLHWFQKWDVYVCRVFFSPPI